jgi:hypothetical protein
MIYGKPALPHHLFNITIRELITAISANAQEDDPRLEVTPLKRRSIVFQEYDSRRLMDGMAQ